MNGPSYFHSTNRSHTSQGQGQCHDGVHGVWKQALVGGRLQNLGHFFANSNRTSAT